MKPFILEMIRSRRRQILHDDTRKVKSLQARMLAVRQETRLALKELEKKCPHRNTSGSPPEGCEDCGKVL